MRYCLDAVLTCSYACTQHVCSCVRRILAAGGRYIVAWSVLMARSCHVSAATVGVLPHVAHAGVDLRRRWAFPSRLLHQLIYDLL